MVMLTEKSALRSDIPAHTQSTAHDISSGPGNNATNGATNGTSKPSALYGDKDKNGIAHDHKAVNGGDAGKGKCPMDNVAAPAGAAVRPTDVKLKDKRKQESGLSGVLTKLSMLRQMSKRSLPTQFADGTYPADNSRPKLSKDIMSLSREDLKTLHDFIKTKLFGRGIVDDKTMLMERLIRLVADMPHRSLMREEVTNKLLTELWSSIDHPPLLYMGDKYKYRQADGSYNNPMLPSLGAAGTAYARSCRPGQTPLGALPDPAMVFEGVMARRKFRKHPNNVSSMLWYWASIIIHDLFWTDMSNPNINKSSSYLDLAPLYGINQAQQNTIRTFNDGMLKPDSFADKRCLGMPPGVPVLLIMLNRFHNQVAEKLAAINEGGRFTKPSPDLAGDKAAQAWKQYDEDLFQTARLVTSGLYINITLVDYVRNIVNLNRVDTTWTLDPRQEMGHTVGTKDGAERGTGNCVSAEFNLLYRWHSCISERDEKWTSDMYASMFGARAEDMSTREMIAACHKFAASIPEDPAERVFNGFKRGADGKFDDDELVQVLTEGIEDVAGAFGARNVPRVMKPIEILGILQGRKWNTAGLNEFRKQFGLKPYETFEDINPDEDVAEALRRLYQHPDHVELYAGTVAEAAKEPMSPGVGIAPTYTISRVVLSDAVCLVRGDRFYTTDYHPRSLTNWGYKEVDYNLAVNHGCIFYKLFLRAFPNHFKANSVYAHYPMVIPSENRKILTDLGRADAFDFERPGYIPERINVTSYGAAKYILENQDKYKVTWGEGLSAVLGEGGAKFMLAGDAPLFAQQRKCMAAQLYREGWKADVKEFYASISEKLLAGKSYRLGDTRQVDIIRDVGNVAHTHFSARVFSLPLKHEGNPKGVLSEQELYKALAVIFTCIFFDFDKMASFPLLQAARGAAEKVGGIVESGVKFAKLGLPVPYVQKLKRDESLSAYGKEMVKGLAKSGLSSKDIAWSHVLPTAAAMVPNQAQVFAQAVDYYLSDEAEPYRAELHRVACLPPTEETDALMLGYAMEGIRLAGTFGSYREVASADTIVEDDGRQIPVKQGDRVFVSFVTAARDPNQYPYPEEVNPRRPLDSYIFYGLGPHACLGRAASQVALTELFRAVFRRPNVRRVPGPQGDLKKVARPGGFYAYMTEDWGMFTPFPVSMKIMWDE